MRFGFRELVFLIVLLAVPTVSLFYVFKPRNREIQQALTEIGMKQARLTKLDEVTAQNDDIGLALEELREAISQIEAKIPPERDVEGILEEVWMIAARNRLNVASVKSEKSVPAASYRELPLKMVVEGDFDGFYEFLLELEKLPRITRVHQLTLERLSHRKTQQSKGVHSMTAEFTLSIYFEPNVGDAS